MSCQALNNFLQSAGPMPGLTLSSVSLACKIFVFVEEVQTVPEHIILPDKKKKQEK